LPAALGGIEIAGLEEPSKFTLMQKLFALLTIVLLAACSNNNNRQSTTNEAAADAPIGLPKDSVARDATFSFIDGCMQNARLTLGDAKAYAYCKCIYGQLQAENPDADSVAIEQLALDTARLARMAAKCR
jgi:hypothetical protein